MADSEVRQKFEAWYGAQPRCLGFPKCDGDLVGLQHSNGCPLAEIDDSGGCSTMTTPFDCYLEGMRAGEIAMKKLEAIVEGSLAAEGMLSPCSICRPSDEHRHEENCPILDAERFLSKAALPAAPEEKK